MAEIWHNCCSLKIETQAVIGYLEGLQLFAGYKDCTPLQLKINIQSFQAK